jgi:hypothetical protein
LEIFYPGVKFRVSNRKVYPNGIYEYMYGFYKAEFANFNFQVACDEYSTCKDPRVLPALYNEITKRLDFYENVMMHVLRVYGSEAPNYPVIVEE